MKQIARIKSEQEQSSAGTSAVAAGAPQFSFVDRSVATLAQRKLAGVIEHSPKIAAQHAFSERIHQSPHMAAQRRCLAGVTGHTAALEAAGREPPLQGKLAAAHTPVLQGVFPDAYNDARRDAQSIVKDAVQLDHMVPQKTLKTFVATSKVLDNLTSAPGSRWTSTKAAMDALRKALKKFDLHEHAFMSEEHLVNLPQNIIPGRTDQIQGAGDDFDPQVAHTGTVDNVDRYEETATSISQRAMDASMDALNSLVHADLLPASAADSKKSAKHDADTDTLLANEVSALARAFDNLGATQEQAYDTKVWYSHGAGNKAVKKRAAEWIKDEGQVTIGGTPAPARASWAHQFPFQTQALGMKGAHVALIPVTVTVDVDVPAATWQHLYDRHFLDTFAGTVEAVDTFWKTDPHTYLTGAGGTALLETELTLILKKSFNFSKPYDNLGEPPDSLEEANWSQAAHKLFFQGSATSLLDAKALGGISYGVGVELKSIAPQDPAIAYALLPSQL